MNPDFERLELRRLLVGDAANVFATFDGVITRGRRQDPIAST